MNKSPINSEWPTEIADLKAAAKIMSVYTELNEGEPLGIIEVVIDKSRQKPLQIRMPEWIQALVTHFRKQYGQEQGQSIASKVITRFLLKDETIH